MPKIINLNYGGYLDIKTGVVFVEELIEDHYLGVADVDDETAKAFIGRAGYKIVAEAPVAPVEAPIVEEVINKKIK